MPIDPLPAVPSRTDPQPTFNAEVAAFFTALAGAFVGQMNAAETNVNAKEAAATAAAAAAAAFAAAAAIGSSFKGNYSAQVGAAAVPYSVYHLSQYWTLLSNLADVTAKVPGTDPEWAAIPTGFNTTAVKTANYTAAANDMVPCDTNAVGAWTLTLPVAPSAGQRVGAYDHAGTWATANLTVARNGLKIMGQSADMVCHTSDDHFILEYTGATYGWKFVY